MQRHVAFLAILLASSTPTPAAPVEPAGAWSELPCPFDTSAAKLRLTCGRLVVPENYDEPLGNRVTIAAMVLRSPAADRRSDPVLFINGGPGAAGLVPFERLVNEPLILELVAKRDWIIFDQRGNGRSMPALRCEQDAKDPTAALKRCRDGFIKTGIDLSQYNSVQIAADAEALRRALGIPEWNLYGSSYGTRVALTIARYYPNAVRTVVHDGAYLPADQEMVSDMLGTEQALERLLDRCALDVPCTRRYPDLKSRFLAGLAAYSESPVSVGETRLDGATLAHALRRLLFNSTDGLAEGVPQTLRLADAIARKDSTLVSQLAASNDDGAGISPQIPESGYSQGQALSVDCNEEKSFESMEEYVKAGDRSVLMQGLMQGPVEEVFASCALWPAGRAAPIENSHVEYGGPQLAFSGDLDASLSPGAAERLVQRYPGARNVIFRNAGHVQLGRHRFRTPSPPTQAYRLCAVRLAAAFFDDPRAELDTRCARTHELSLVGRTN